MSAPARPVPAAAVAVADLHAARRFYVGALGCDVVQTSSTQLSLALHGQPLTLLSRDDAAVDGIEPAEVSFLLTVDDWCAISECLREAGVDHAVEPGKRFAVAPGEQCAMRLEDPDGNRIVLRGFALEAGQLAA